MKGRSSLKKTKGVRIAKFFEQNETKGGSTMNINKICPLSSKTVINSKSQPYVRGE